MRLQQITLTVLGLFAWSWADCGPPRANAADRKVSTGMKLELKALKERMKWQRGRVVVRAKTTKGPFHRPKDAAVNHTFDILFDRELIRVSNTDHRRMHGITHIFNGEDYIEFPHKRDLKKGDYARLLSRRLVEDGRKSGTINDDLLHPRILGAYPISFFALDQCRIERILAVDDRDGETVKDEFIGKIPVKHISYTRSQGQQMNMWIAPSMNHSILKLEVSSRGYESSVQSKYSKLKNGIWFPRQVVFRSSKNGRLREEQTWKIESAELNAAVDHHKFTLESLNPAVGETINKDGRDLIWDGRKLVSAK